jgi:hypothetical protein
VILLRLKIGVAVAGLPFIYMGGSATQLSKIAGNLIEPCKSKKTLH